MKQKVLIFSDGVSLAHATRAVRLVSELDLSKYEIYYATDSKFFGLLKATMFKQLIHLNSLPSGEFNRRTTNAKPIFTKNELSQFISEDLEIIDRIRPDLILGDFRLSLSISARVAGVTYINLTNSHWGPYSKGLYTLPDHPIFKFIGKRLSEFFHKHFLREPILTFFMAGHLKGVNSLRKQHGQKPFKNIYEFYADGDYIFYLEHENFIPFNDLPHHHIKIGPISWSSALPKSNKTLIKTTQNKSVLISLGSTGNINIINKLVEMFKPLDYSVMITTAGRLNLGPLDDKFAVSDYFPMDKACELADLVICNGGSATAYHALAKGKPVLGITSNTDQVLTMSYIEEAGAGRLLRDWQFNSKDFLNLFSQLMCDTKYQINAQRISQYFNFEATKKMFVKQIYRISKPSSHQQERAQ